MPFTTPIPFTAAIASLMAREAMPTNLSSAELRDIAADVRAKSLFSARTNNERYLEDIRSVIESILNPTLRPDSGPLTPDSGPRFTGFNPATARVKLREALDSIGYAPDKPGSIEDLSSDQRINLVLRTNTEQAQSVGRLTRVNDPDVLAVAPAWEFVRFGQRMEPRDWVARFRLAGQLSGRPLNDGWTITPDRRMVALVNHPIWQQLGSSANWDDALDTAYPPFAFNSGMDWISIDVDEAEDLGIIAPGQAPLTSDLRPPTSVLT